jgi:hypothetical protein
MIQTVSAKISKNTVYQKSVYCKKKSLILYGFLTIIYGISSHEQNSQLGDNYQKH